MQSVARLDQALTNFTSLAERRPELRLNIARLLIEKTLRRPGQERNWQVAEQAVQEAQKARPEAIQSLTLLRADLLEGQGRGEEARAIIAAAHAKDPRNLSYRLALAGLAARMGKRRSELADSRSGQKRTSDQAPGFPWQNSPAGQNREAARPRRPSRNSPRLSLSSPPTLSPDCSHSSRKLRYGWASRHWPDSASSIC